MTYKTFINTLPSWQMAKMTLRPNLLDTVKEQEILKTTGL